MSKPDIPPSPKAQTNRKKKRSGKNRWPPKDIEEVITPYPIKTVSLYDGFLDIALEWCYKLNCNFGPEDFNYASRVKVWWCCQFNKKHIWKAPIGNRTLQGTGCPFCYDSTWGVDLRDFPKVMKLFDKEKNKRVNPQKLPIGKAVWWRCAKASDHVWKGWFKFEHADCLCPFCSEHRPSSTYSIENSDILRDEFHPQKNKGLKAKDLTPGSGVKVWWQCSTNNSHVWQATVGDRSNGDGCPYCSRRLLSKEFTLGAHYPRLAREFHPTKNDDLKPSTISSAYRQAIWWQCVKDPSHEWKDVIRRRVEKQRGCPFCDNVKVSKQNSLQFNNPDIAKEFDLELNSPLTSKDVVFCSPKRVHWRCPAGHEYTARILDRTVYGKGCLKCNPTLRSKPLSRYKSLVAELHPTKNGKLNPEKISSVSEYKLWWQCLQSSDHVWEISPNNRVRLKSGCPFCSNQKVSKSNSLATLRPDVAKELHPTKNKGMTAADIVPGSAKSVWWQCARNPKHSWQSAVFVRTRSTGSGCPTCGTGIGGQIIRGTALSIAHPDVAKDWHPTKNGSLKPEDVKAKSEQRVWWRCHLNQHFVWEQEIGERVRRGCQYCKIADKSLKKLFPDITKRLHPTKNPGFYAEAVTSGSNKIAWWICAKDRDHIYEASVRSVTRNGSGCPYCYGHKVHPKNSLATLYPEVAAEWNRKKNGDLSPGDVSKGSSAMVWWICKNKHEWQTQVASRTLQGSGCRVCSYESRRK